MTIKDQFPILTNNPDLIYLDNGATTLKPKQVLDKMQEYYTDYSANIHRGVYGLSEQATEEYEKAREKVAKFVGAETGEVVFTGGTTGSINLVARGWGELNIKEDDEIVVTDMEHHSNLVPWQMLAKKMKAVLKFIPVVEGILDLESINKLVSVRTKVVALTHVSNVLGSVNPVREIVGMVKNINPEVVVVVDGAQAVAHMPVSVNELGCDFYAFSGHKVYGPTGVGVLWGRRKLLEEMEPINYGGGMIREVTKLESRWASVPDKFEGGTPPIAQAIGLGAAVDFILGLGWNNITEQENETIKYAMEQLSDIEGLEVTGPLSRDNRTGAIAFNLKGVHPHDAASILSSHGVCVRAGHHCAQPLHEKLGLMATVRASLGVYNSKEDVDRLVEAIKACIAVFSKVKLTNE